jgi:hypothetical protein
MIPAEKANENSQLPARHDSWEIEILISGGAFFSLYQLSGYVNSLLPRTSTGGGFSGVNFMMTFVAVGIRLLAIYFAIHLCVRAFWLSFVLLRKIYPQGIDTSRLNFREPYSTITSRVDQNANIQRMDTLAGLTFSWSVVSSIAFVGVGLAISLTILPFRYLMTLDQSLEYATWFILLQAVVAISGFAFVIDTMSFGPLRRHKLLAIVYRPMYLYWNVLSLGFLWRPGLQTIFSNAKSKWKAFSFALLATLVVILFAGNEEDYLRLVRSNSNFREGRLVAEHRYQDKRKEGEWRGTFIQSDVIKEGYLRIHVYYNPRDNRELGPATSDRKFFSDMIKVRINDSTYASLHWVGSEQDGGELGIHTVVGISHLANKMHILKIQRSYDTAALEIPFWKQ